MPAQPGKWFANLDIGEYLISSLTIPTSSMSPLSESLLINLGKCF
jgi:hypothetical protein